MRAAGIHAHDFGAEQSHAEDVEPLALHVFRAHVDHAFEAQPRRDRRRGDSVLSRAGFGDDAALPHAHGQQALAEAVVDLVRAGMEQVFALDVDARSAQMLGQPRSKLQRSRAAGKILEQGVQFSLETRVLTRLLVGALEFLERRNERLGNVTSAVGTETALRVRPSLCSGDHWSFQVIQQYQDL